MPLGCPECGSLRTHKHADGCSHAERELTDAVAQLMFAGIMKKTAAFKENPEQAYWMMPQSVREAFRQEASHVLTGLRDQGWKVEHAANAHA